MSLAAQILGLRFAALAREGATSFAAMSRSPLVIDEGQYACALLDGTGQLIAQDQGEPSQLAAVQASVAHLLDAFAYDLAEGDVILTGDPYCGGTWGGVLTLAVPVFAEGDLHFVTAIRFAVADLAGNVPGPFQPDAHEIWQEALRLTPVKLLKAGAMQKDIRAYVTRNSRAPGLLDSDLTTATVTAQRLARNVTAMIDQKGLAPVQEAARHRISYGAARARAALEGIGAGQASDGGISVALTPAPEGLSVDLSGTAPAGEDARNMTLTATRGVILTQLLAEVIEDTGLSQGILDAVQVAAPECCLNAEFPAALSLGWRELAPVLSRALGRAGGGQVAFDPAPPLMVLFPTIGTMPVMQPVTLSPGFAPGAGLAGGDAAGGRRRLISAEEAEAAGLFRLDTRELTEEGLAAQVTLMSAGLEGISVPGAEAPAIVQDTPLERPRSNVLSLAMGAQIRFTYPQREAAKDAKR